MATQLAHMVAGEFTDRATSGELRDQLIDQRVSGYAQMPISVLLSLAASVIVGRRVPAVFDGVDREALAVQLKETAKLAATVPADEALEKVVKITNERRAERLAMRRTDREHMEALQKSNDTLKTALRAVVEAAEVARFAL